MMFSVRLQKTARGTEYVAKRANLEFVGPDALKNDPLDQSLIACGKSLRSMAGSGQFVDDGTCD